MTPWHFNVLMPTRPKYPKTEFCMLSVMEQSRISLYIFLTGRSAQSPTSIPYLTMWRLLSGKLRKLKKKKKERHGNIGRERWGPVQKHTKARCYLTCINKSFWCTFSKNMWHHHRPVFEPSTFMLKGTKANHSTTVLPHPTPYIWEGVFRLDWVC